VNYGGFNKSIKNFSDILNNLESSQKKIKSLEDDIDRCKELLASRANDLAQLYANYLQHTEFLNILNQVYARDSTH
jgi:exocyst complex component 4